MSTAPAGPTLFCSGLDRGDLDVQFLRALGDDVRLSDKSGRLQPILREPAGAFLRSPFGRISVVRMMPGESSPRHGNVDVLFPDRINGDPIGCVHVEGEYGFPYKAHYLRRGRLERTTLAASHIPVEPVQWRPVLRCPT